jgi:CheY-like chemotaxis protein
MAAATNFDPYDNRNRLNQVRVLLADRDSRTSTLVHRTLFSFGFRHIDMVNSGEAALESLRRNPYDLIITEWNMAPTDGLTLVKEIRRARDDQRIRRDIPIIMLTAQSEKDNVEAARDAGINEFIVKPFTAKTISNRIVTVVDNPRSFIEAPGYIGPDRRRREKMPEGFAERRGRDEGAFTLPPNGDLREQIGEAREVFTERVIQEAQAILMQAEPEFVAWAKDDIITLESAYAQLKAQPSNPSAHKALLDAAYSIKSQAGIFGYDLGTGIASMLVRYLNEHDDIREEKLTVVRKHIDAIVVIFTQKIKESGRDIGQELINSLRVLTKKIG